MAWANLPSDVPEPWASAFPDKADAPKVGNQNIIKAAIVETGGNQTRAAERLGLQRTHLVKL